MKILYITIGLDSDEKKNYLKKHFDTKTIVSPVEIRNELYEGVYNPKNEPAIWMTATKRLKDTLNEYGEAVLDSTNTNATHRKGFMAPFKKMQDIEFVAVVFPTEPKTAKSILTNNSSATLSAPQNIAEAQYKEFIRGYSAIKYQFDKVKVVEPGELKLSNLLKEIRNAKKRLA